MVPDSYLLTARATDNEGLSGVSDPVAITVRVADAPLDLADNDTSNGTC